MCWHLWIQPRPMLDISASPKRNNRISAFNKLNVILAYNFNTTECRWRRLVFIKHFKSHLSACVDRAGIRAGPPDGSQVMHQTNAGITLQVTGATIYLIKTKCFPWSASAYALISLSAQTTKSVCGNRRHTGAIDHSRPNVIPPFGVGSFPPDGGWISAV